MWSYWARKNKIKNNKFCKYIQLSRNNGQCTYSLINCNQDQQYTLILMTIMLIKKLLDLQENNDEKYVPQCFEIMLMTFFSILHNLDGNI